MIQGMSELSEELTETVNDIVRRGDRDGLLELQALGEQVDDGLWERAGQETAHLRERASGQSSTSTTMPRRSKWKNTARQCVRHRSVRLRLQGLRDRSLRTTDSSSRESAETGTSELSPSIRMVSSE